MNVFKSQDGANLDFAVGREGLAVVVAFDAVEVLDRTDRMDDWDGDVLS